MPEAKEGTSPLTPDENGKRPRVACSKSQCRSAQPAGSIPFSDITNTNLKRQVLEGAMDPAAKKRMIDKNYRDRCKKKQIDTKRNLDMLVEENNRLNSKISSLEVEEARVKRTLQSKEEEMKQLQKKYAQLKDKSDKQSTINEVLSEKLAAASNAIELQRENTQLKNRIALLMNQINNGDNFNIIQLLQKNAELEGENRVQNIIVEALCEKMNNDKDNEKEQPSQGFIKNKINK